MHTPPQPKTHYCSANYRTLYAPFPYRATAFSDRIQHGRFVLAVARREFMHLSPHQPPLLHGQKKSGGAANFSRGRFRLRYYTLCLGAHSAHSVVGFCRCFHCFFRRVVRRINRLTYVRLPAGPDIFFLAMQISDFTGRLLSAISRPNPGDIIFTTSANLTKPHWLIHARPRPYCRKAIGLYPRLGS